MAKSSTPESLDSLSDDDLKDASRIVRTCVYRLPRCRLASPVREEPTFDAFKGEFDRVLVPEVGNKHKGEGSTSRPRDLCEGFAEELKTLAMLQSLFSLKQDWMEGQLSSLFLESSAPRSPGDDEQVFCELKWGQRRTPILDESHSPRMIESTSRRVENAKHLQQGSARGRRRRRRQQSSSERTRPCREASPTDSRERRPWTRSRTCLLQDSQAREE